MLANVMWGAHCFVPSTERMFLLTVTTSHESKLCGNGSGATGNMADSNNSNLVSNAPEDSLVVNASSSRQFAVLQQYRDSLEARSTPRLEKKLPYLANPQPGTSAEIQLHQFDSHSSTVMNSSQQVRHTSLNQLEQRRSLLTPIIPPGECEFVSDESPIVPTGLLRKTTSEIYL